MSYQMSRVRGAEAYRLLVTRATNLETICSWIGVDKERLLATNPGLEGDELEEGQELMVLASYVHPQFDTEPRSDEAEHESQAYGGAEESDDPQVPSDEPASTTSSEAEGEADVESASFETTPALPDDAPAINDVGVEEEATEEPRDGGVGVTAESVVTKRSPAQPTDEAARPEPTVTWRPFPKSVL